MNGANGARLIVNYCDGCWRSVEEGRDNGPQTAESAFKAGTLRTFPNLFSSLALFLPCTFVHANEFSVALLMVCSLFCDCYRLPQTKLLFLQCWTYWLLCRSTKSPSSSFHVCLNQTPVGTFLEQHRVTFAKHIQDAAVSFEWPSPG